MHCIYCAGPLTDNGMNVAGARLTAQEGQPGQDTINCAVRVVNVRGSERSWG